LKKGVSEKNILCINKESLEYDFIHDYQDLNKFVKNAFTSEQGKRYLFIDEVQEIKLWEKAVTSLFTEEKTDIYITGSNAHLLSSELATLLSGRYVSFPIYPLCFQEFLQFRNTTPQKADLNKEFSLFLQYGGLPGIHFLDFKEEVIYHYLNSIFNTILLKDVVTRHRIRDVSQLKNITRFVFDNCGQIVSSKRISDYLKSQKIRITVDTVQNYLHYLQNAFLISKTSRYDLKGKRHLEFYEKYYMGEIGMRHGFIGYRKDDISGLLENIVYLELLKRGYNVSIGKLEDKEIDFIAEKEKSRLYFQVAYLLASPETEIREFSPLERINDNYTKIVLSMDKDWGEERRGILRKNIIQFLLED
jgi:predicted AAA+ superfamily ATPase